MRVFLVWITFLISVNCKIPNGAVVTNSPKCAKIGTSILEKGGTVVDAAIAALFCEGASLPNTMGLGGGFIMNIFIKSEIKTEVLVATEVAPIKANSTMFGNDRLRALKGGLAVAVPGELKGYWEAYRKYGGRVAWKDLIQPTIDLCKNGIQVTKYLNGVFKRFKEVIQDDFFLRKTFNFTKSTNFTNPLLAKTLAMVAESGPDVLYNGSLTRNFVKDIQAKGGIITEEDFQNYKVRWEQPVKVDLPFGETLYAAPLPTTGKILGNTLTTLSPILDYSQPQSIKNWQKIIETFKYGFGERTRLSTNTTFPKKTILDNRTFQNPSHYGAKILPPKDHGTANICVLAPNGDAVVVTSSINSDFGAGFMSGSTGIILNNHMDAFSSACFLNKNGIPPTLNNLIEAGKRPLISFNPSIITKNGNVKLLIGGSGGTKIFTSVATVIMKNQWFNYTIQKAIADKRVHHQLFPMEVQFEYEYWKEKDLIDNFAVEGNLVDGLAAIGHKFSISAPNDGSNAVTAIARENGTLYGVYDPRRGGEVSYIYGEG